jgi:transketolase
MAVASQWLGARYNRNGHTLFDFDVYAQAGDGCMMEGISSEAASFAAHQRLQNLCWIYDSNRVTIEGHTDITFTEDVAGRFTAYGWNVTSVADANDLEQVAKAFHDFKAEHERPTLILVHSHIGYGSPVEDSPKAHGEPFGVEGVKATKRFLGMPDDIDFYAPDEVYEAFADGLGARGQAARTAWETLFGAYRAAHPGLADELDRIQRRELPDGWDSALPTFAPDPKGIASRDSSGQVLNMLAHHVPWLLGGSADLSPSTKTRLTFEAAGDFDIEDRDGRNLHYGVREHAATAVSNGLSLSKVRPFWSGFLIFSDYARGALRLSALMEIPVIHIFTHDSIGVGEDGPTHQPVEQLIGLRAVPGLTVIRPGDANEVVEAWRLIMQTQHEPVALILSRQALPTLDRSRFAAASGLANGAYVLADPADGAPPELILIGTGSEVSLAVAAWEQLTAEGVKRVAVVSVEPEKFPPGALPAGVTLHHRDDLASVQKELRDVAGVSALVYDQTCAAEARRLRKRGEFPDPDRRIVINEQVCEGCGDCSVQSNCISIEPVETELGRKRRINQSSCNKDYSCVKGYCPSFVSVLGGKVRKATGEGVAAADALFTSLPEPSTAECEEPWNVLMAGIGGTGVVTVGAILAVAAHLEGKGCSELDVTGLAQKNGAVSSHVRIARDPGVIFASRIGVGGADLVLGCDLVVATSFENLPRSRRGRSFSVMNRDVAPTADFARNSDLDLSSERMEAAVRAACGDEGARFVNASQLATVLLGDAIAANMILLGVAAQLGKLPVSLAALDRAIELNGRQVAMNRRAFAWGRLLAHDPAAVEKIVKPLLRGGAGAPLATTLDEIVAHRTALLTAYQSAKYAERYRALVARVAERERAAAPGSDALARAVARNYAKLLAYKDEYEVARLYTDGSFAAQVAREFEGDVRLQLHLSPQFLPAWLAPRDPETGHVRKWRIPTGLIFPFFRALRPLKALRGTPFDPFGWLPHRRWERRLIAEYEATVAELLDGLTAENLPVAVELASLPEHVRGFDDVKERQHQAAEAKRLELLAAFRLRS